jgi:hypothetical protein
MGLFLRNFTLFADQENFCVIEEAFEIKSHPNLDRKLKLLIAIPNDQYIDKAELEDVAFTVLQDLRD